MSRHLVSWLLALAVSWPVAWAQEVAPAATAGAPGSDLERLFRVLVAKHRQRLPQPPAPGAEVTVRPLAGGPVTGVVLAITPSRVQLETELGRVWVPAQGVAPESLAALFPDRAALLLALRDFDLLKKARAAGGAAGGWGVQEPAGGENSLGRAEPEAVSLPAEPESVPLPADAGKSAPGAPVMFDLTPAKSPAALKPVVAAFGQWLGFQQRRVGGRLASAVHAKRQGAAAVLYVTVAPEFQAQDYDIRYQIAEGMWYFWAFRGVEMGVVPHPERAYLVLVSPGGRIAGGSSPDGAAKLWVEEKPPKERPVKPEPTSAPDTPPVVESAGEAPVPSPPSTPAEPVATPAAPAEETTPALPAEIPSDKAALITAYAGKTPLWLATPWAADSQRRVPLEIAAHGNATLTLPAALPAGTLVLRVVVEYEPDIRRRGGNALSAYGWRWPAIGPDGNEVWAGQFLRLRLNDQLVWARWRTETQRLLTVVLPGDLRNQGREDRLMCENDADAPLNIVALWAERPAPGAPVWVALGGMAWAERPETWRRMPVVVEELSLLRPPQPVAGQDGRASWGHPFEKGCSPSPFPKLLNLKPDGVSVTSSSGKTSHQTTGACDGNAIRIKEQKGLAEGLGTAFPQKGVPNERAGQVEAALDAAWRPVLERVKAGGARVVVRCEVRNDGDVETLAVAGARYGAQVLAWQLRVANGNLGRTAVERLRRVCPNAQVAVDTLPARGSLPVAAVLTGGEAGGGYGVEAKVARTRETLRRAGAGEAAARPWLDSAVTEAGGLASQCHVGWAAAEATAAWLDAGGGPVTWWNGGGWDCGLFPQEEERPGEAWTLVRLLTGIGGATGEARAWYAGLVPVEGDAGTTLARWAAGIEPSGRINVLLFGGDDTGREFVLTVPVPRHAGTWRAVIEGARQPPNEQPPVAQKTERREVECQDARGGDTGLVRIKLKLDTVMRITLVPPDARAAAADNGGREPNVKRTPLPPERRRAAPLVQQDVWALEEAGDLPTVAEWRTSGLPVAESREGAPTALGQGVKIERRPATPGQLGRLTGVAPYTAESWLVTFDAPEKWPTEPLGVVLPLAATALPDARVVRFWVRPVLPPEQRKKVVRPRPVSLRLGTAGLSAIRLKPGVWTRVEAPLTRLTPASTDRNAPLRILPGTDTVDALRHDVAIEINGLHLAGPRSPQGTPVVTGAVRALRPRKGAPPGPARLLVELEKPAGAAAVLVEYRLPEALVVKAVQERLFGLAAVYESTTRLVRVTGDEWPAKPAKDAEKALAAIGNEQLGRRWDEGERGLLLLELAAPAATGTAP